MFYVLSVPRVRVEYGLVLILCTASDQAMANKLDTRNMFDVSSAN